MVDGQRLSIEFEGDQREWVVGEVGGEGADSVEAGFQRGQADVVAAIAADESNEITDPYATPFALGAPPLHAGDRQIAAVLWQGSQLIDGQFPRHRPAADRQPIVGAAG